MDVKTSAGILSLFIILAVAAGEAVGQYEGDCSLIFYESFESLDGVTGNNGSYSGTGLVQDGWDGRGALIDGNDTLSYSKQGSLDLEKGSIEMWVRPQWDGDDGESHFFFHYWVESEAMLSVHKGDNSNLAFYIYHNRPGHPDDAVSYWVGDWNADGWHHIAATWRTDTAGSDFLRLYIDRELVAELAGQDFPPLNTSSEAFKIGYVDYGWIQQYRAYSVMDELMIFNYVIDYEQPPPGFDSSFGGYPFGAVPASIISDEGPRDFSLAVEAGITETKSGVTWGDIEKAKGVYSWDDPITGEHGGLFDTDIRSAQSKNITVDLLTIGPRKPYYMDCRNSSCPSEEYPTAESGCLYDDVNRNDFKKFVYNAVERYDGDGVCDVPGLQEGIRAWRYGTELGKGTWCGTGGDFLVVYEDIYHAVKSADPNAMLMFGGLNAGVFGCVVDYQCHDWIRDNAWDSVELFDYIYSNIDSGHVDAFGIHPYDKWYQIPGRIDAMNSYLAGKGLDNKPLWVIEEGEIIEHGLITEESDRRQAEEIVKRFVISMSRGIEHINWFDLYWYHGCLNVNCSCALGEPHPLCEPPCCYGQDDNGNYVGCPMLEQCEECAFAKYHCYGPYNDPCGGTCLGTKNGNHENMALLEYDEFEPPPETNKYKKRPGFYTYRLMTEKLGGYDYVGIISEDGPAYYGYEFSVNSSPVWVLWTNGTAYDLDLDTGSDALVTHIITDRGSAEPATELMRESGGIISLSINETPVFVERTTLHRADTEPPFGCIVIGELGDFIDFWMQNSTAYPMREMMEAVVLWKAGTGCS